MMNSSVGTMNLAPVPFAQQSLLLKLPSEIKDVIWSYAVTHSEPIKPRQWRGNWGKIFLDNKNLTGIQFALTCRQIHNEMLGETLFYKNNDFHFAHMDTMTSFLELLSLQQRRALKSIFVYYNQVDPVLAFLTLDTCTGLRDLTLDITMMPYYFDFGKNSFHDAPGYKEMINLRGLKNFRLTYGIGEAWSLPLQLNRQIGGSSVTEEEEVALNKEIRELEKSLSKIVTLPRFFIQ